MAIRGAALGGSAFEGLAGNVVVKTFLSKTWFRRIPRGQTYHDGPKRLTSTVQSYSTDIYGAKPYTFVLEVAQPVHI